MLFGWMIKKKRIANKFLKNIIQLNHVYNVNVYSNFVLSFVVSLMPDTVNRVLWAADDGWNTTETCWEIDTFK